MFAQSRSSKGWKLINLEGAQEDDAKDPENAEGFVVPTAKAPELKPLAD